MTRLDSSERELFDVDYLSAAAWDEFAHDRMRRLRKDAPIYWAPQNELWVVSKYDDIVEISRDPELFCSSQGIRPGIPVRQALIDEDDPKHCQLRRTINRGFTPRMVKLLEEKFETITREAIDSVASVGHCDFVASIAVPLPAILIAEMIGIPKLDHHRFHEWSDAMMRADGHYDDAEIMGRAGKAALEYSIYIKDVIEQRRAVPCEDLISALVAADDAGILGKLDLESIEGSGEIAEDALELAADELVMVLVTLMVAGNETTRNALSGSVELLIRRLPDMEFADGGPIVEPHALVRSCTRMDVCYAKESH